MAELATLARPYAKAAFDIAKRSSQLDRWSRLLLIAASTSETPKVATLLASPEVGDQQKAFKLADLCGDEIDDLGRKFLNVLAENKRLTLLPEVHAQFEALKALDERSLDVHVASAFELSGAELDRIVASLKSRFDKEVTVTTEVDKSLIGGAVIRAGDTVIDGSVRGRLNRLGETLSQA